jgi:hypothetical protein
MEKCGRPSLRPWPVFGHRTGQPPPSRDSKPNANGERYSFTPDRTAISLTEAAEWMNMERLCCPFLTLQLSAGGGQGNWRLTLTGPKGVKPLLEAEFPAPGQPDVRN